MAPQNRNVNFTGTNALYTKAGTLKGARVVASKATLSSIANSNVSTNNVRAYRIAVTNRGSIYYKVVTFNGQYRGWIYGGKDDSDFAGGVTHYTTFNNQSLSSLTTAQQNATYKIANPGTANDGKTVTYKSPAWTQYKVGRAITDSTPYANSVFKIDQVGTRTRENDQWVHIYDVNNANSPANGWILMSGLATTQAPIADNAIQINLVDPSNNSNVVKSVTITRSGAQKGTNFGYYSNGSWTMSQSDISSIQNQIRAALNGTSYGLDSLSTAQIAQIAQTNFGSSTNLVVNKIANIADNAVRINLVKPDGTTLKYTDWVKSGANKGSNVGFQPSGNTLWSLYSGDQTSIQNQIISALSGTNFQLSGNALTSAQMDTIARGTYGGQVYISVVPVSSATSTVTPYFKAPSSGTSIALTANSGGSVNTTVQLKLQNGTNSGSSIAAGKVQAADVQKVVDSYVDADKAKGSASNATTQRQAAYDGLNAVNEAIYNAAQNEYALSNLNFNGLKGTSGNSFGIVELTASLTANNLLQIPSPNFPLFKLDSNNKVLEPTSDHIAYTYNLGDTGGFLFSGTYGTPVKVVYEAPAFTKQTVPTDTTK